MTLLIIGLFIGGTVGLIIACIFVNNKIEQRDILIRMDTNLLKAYRQNLDECEKRYAELVETMAARTDQAKGGAR